MSDSDKRRIVVIVGPTAGGKSELAVALAERLRGLPAFRGGQVISADSMQVYRHMEAGTAKPSIALRRRVPHHLIDIIEPTERFTVADWLVRAEGVIADVQAAKAVPIVVGGTNLYIKALLEGMFEGPAIDTELRASLEEFDSDRLHQRLVAVDPAAAGRIHRNDRKKLIRAIEVYEVTGKPISAMQTQWEEGETGSRGDKETRRQGDMETEVSRLAGDASGGQRPTSPSTAPGGRASGYRHHPIMIGLDWPVEQINRRINARVKAMFNPGDPSIESLPDEVRRLEAAGLLGAPASQARQALGYKQVLEHLADPSHLSLDDAMERTKILTRRFAKSQRTWLRRYRAVLWLAAYPYDEPRLAEQAAEYATSQLTST
ncbi:MAG: tRNA (adenosine(37)-N6)-dimethylallyltransferase MiaA [Phycisphaeraceae bacterium]